MLKIFLDDWSDNVRDIINFLLNYLPDSAEPNSTLPTHLQRVPAKVSEIRAKCGFSHRTLGGIGHSFGGTSLYEDPSCRRTGETLTLCLALSGALAAINEPMLFSSLVLVDPIVLPPPPPGKVKSWVEGFGVFPTMIDFVDGALTRRGTWKSKFVVL